MTQVVKLPSEITELAVQVSPHKRDEVREILSQIFTGTEQWDKQVDSIEVKGLDDKMSIQLAETARKNAKQARLSAEKIFDAKRREVQNMKVEFDLEDKLWLKAKQIMQIKFKAIEDKAEWKANYVNRHQAQQRELRTQKRINAVAKFAEINRIEFENMTDESFSKFMIGLEKAYQSKLEAERKAIEKLEAEAKAEATAREQQRLENERLRAEAKAREKELAEERAKLRTEQEAKVKLQSELQAKKDAERKAQEEARQKELNAKQESDRLAKAPIKQQLSSWVDGFSLPTLTLKHQTKQEIQEKFNAFKKWAYGQINNI
jgi:hypothetical protein